MTVHVAEVRSKHASGPSLAPIQSAVMPSPPYVAVRGTNEPPCIRAFTHVSRIYTTRLQLTYCCICFPLTCDAGAAPPAPPATPAARDGTAPPLPAAGNAEATSAPAAGGAGGVTMEALAAALAAAADPSAFQPTPLTAVMDSSAILSLLDDEALVNRLLPLLPEGQQDVESLREIICSPQLRAGVAALGGALSTDNYQSVFANFGLNPADGADEMARGDGPGAFLSALQALVDRERAARSDGGETGAEEGGTGEGGAGGDGAGGDADME